MPDTPPSSRSARQPRVASLVPESEGRIVDYVDKRVDTLQQNLDRRLDKQDAMLDEIRQDIKGHLSEPGHPAGLQMHEALKERVDDIESRPLATWQVISGIIFILMTICSLSMGVVSLLFGVIIPHLSLK